MRRSSRGTLSRAVAATAGLIVAVVALGVGAAVADHGSDAADGVTYSPYVHIFSWPDTTGSGIENLTVAFVLSYQDTCTPAWDASDPVSNEERKGDIDQIVANGGEVIISFGGAAGRPLEEVCDDPASLKTAIAEVVDTYGVTHLDWDIEGPLQYNDAANERRDIALAELQAEYAAAGDELEISYTLPVTTFDGLTAVAQDVLRNARDRGVRIDELNIMTMNFGPYYAPLPETNMGEYSIEAATATQAQLQEIYPDKSDRQAWEMLVITPMIGQNDTSAERFYPEDARQVREFAIERGINRISTWSMMRDRQCPEGTYPWARADCSGVLQFEWEFSHAFLGHSGSVPPTTTAPLPTPTTTTTVVPGEAAVSFTTTSSWGSGYCSDAVVTTTGEDVVWNISFDIDGSVSTLWNAGYEQAGLTVSVSGSAWNATVSAGSSTSFGFCATGTPPTTKPPTPTTTQPPTTTTTTTAPSGVILSETVTSDWGPGYCSRVDITTSSPTPIEWAAVFEVDGQITILWNGTWTQAGSTATAIGYPWNATVSASTPASIGFCAAR